ncbi:MAG: hypothetical protein DMF63_16880 [Acidobacteria bacterium]|nr:MAG: hypothetical protein DMF63_16880 [Acidobacteriota bacterium]
MQDRFLIEEKIGMGGMGAVYRAIDQKFGSTVAIKRTFYGDDELAKAFEREARLLNGLHHPILPHVSDYFSENGEHFLVMEYIEGEDLSELLKRGETFPVSTVLGWTLDLLDGLDYLHSQDPPVIHRDIKPHNMKLTSRGKIMLLDFGMAKETSANTLATKSVFGYSRRYSPFEQIEGTGTDVRADIFSLGASVYHLLTGQPPVDVLRRVSAIVAGQPDPMIPASEMNANVSSAVSDLLSTALALNAEHRFESARAMWNALEYSINADTGQQEYEPLAAGTAASGILIPDDASVEEEVTRPVATPAAVEIGSQEGSLASGLGSQNLKRKLRGAIPASVSRVRIARPSVNSRSAKWLSIAAACLVVAVLTIYLFSRDREDLAGENEPTSAVATTESIPAASDTIPTTEDTQQGTLKTEPNETRAARNQTVARVKNPDVQAPADAADPEKELTEETRSTTPDRRTINKRASAQRPRVVEPAFEQPSVSSIDAILTGVPDDRRDRWVDDRNWTEDELRRRQIRRIIRENRRRQQPF